MVFLFQIHSLFCKLLYERYYNLETFLHSRFWHLTNWIMDTFSNLNLYVIVKKLIYENCPYVPSLILLKKKLIAPFLLIREAYPSAGWSKSALRSTSEIIQKMMFICTISILKLTIRYHPKPEVNLFHFELWLQDLSLQQLAAAIIMQDGLRCAS